MAEGAPRYMVGTPQYMPPEQARGDTEIDFRSDIYALGGTLYHLITGEPPHSGASVTEIANKQIYEPPVPAEELNPEISVPCRRLLARTLNKNPAGAVQQLGPVHRGAGHDPRSSTPTAARRRWIPPCWRSLRGRIWCARAWWRC